MRAIIILEDNDDATVTVGFHTTDTEHDFMENPKTPTEALLGVLADAISEALEEIKPDVPVIN